MDTLASVKANIEQAQRKATEELRDLQQHALARNRNLKLDRLMSKRREKLERRLEAIDNQLDAIELLTNDLRELRAKGAFRHIITVQPCPKCREPEHGNSEYCPSDIIYYNLDPLLLRKLLRFRRLYFQKDKFLPTPFRREELQKARARYLRREGKR